LYEPRLYELPLGCRNKYELNHIAAYFSAVTNFRSLQIPAGANFDRCKISENALLAATGAPENQKLAVFRECAKDRITRLHFYCGYKSAKRVPANIS